MGGHRPHRTAGMAPLLATALLASTPPAHAGDEDAGLARAQALDRQCEVARAAKLAPLRKRLIARCVAREDLSREECTAKYGDYGNNTSGALGATIPGLYYNLPACRAAKAAWRDWEQSQPWKR